VPFFSLPAPDWASVVGEATESPWIISRNRKIDLAVAEGRSKRELADFLEREGRLFEASADLLHIVPNAIDWYLDLAGLPQKTLGNVKSRYAAFGLDTSPATLRKRLQERLPVLPRRLDAFVGWINGEIAQVHPIAHRSKERALDVVLAIVGARIQGQVQNQAGDDAIDQLKQEIVRRVRERDVYLEYRSGGEWSEFREGVALDETVALRLAGAVVCDFTPGGNRADWTVTRDDVVLFVAEVKGRKDLSNVWESWMPQIYNHLRTWVQEHSDAPRGFLGTLITEEMVEGRSSQGTQHVGLRGLKENGLLHCAINLSKVASGAGVQREQFNRVVDALIDGR
jgi:hypothetical protein